jgi:hypothetical protein
VRYFLRHGEVLDRDHLPEPLQVPPIRKAMEVLHMVTQSDLERERYEARLKYRRDELARLYDAEQRGIEQGRACGILIGQVQVYEKLLMQAPTPPEALQAMTLEQLQELVDRLGTRLAEKA